MKRILLSLLLAAMLAVGLASIANAEKIYSKPDADAICTYSVNKLLDDLTVLAAKGLTNSQLKQAIQTKDPEVRGLIMRFIDEVLQGKQVEATATLILIQATCSQKLQEVEA